MRDQPFKRFFPSEKKAAKETYKYPTYQHYYEPKVSELGAILNPKQSQINPKVPPQSALASTPKKNIENPKDNVKKDSGSNLKTELEHLKNEVHKIIEKKQVILRSPIERRLSAKRPSDTEAQASEDSDTQSVSSDKIFGETNRKLEVRRASDNYDYSKYMQLENNLLKTELRNLKNKYLNKKRELTEKCEALEQKVNFLQNALFKSQQALVNEVALLKQALREAQKGDSRANIPTSDKSQSKEVVQNQSELIGEKMKALYQQLNEKNKIIFDQQTQIDNHQTEMRKIKKESTALLQKNTSLLSQLQESKKNYDNIATKYQILNLKVQKLQKMNEQLTKKSLKAQQQALSLDSITALKESFDQQINKLQNQKIQWEDKYQKNCDELLITKEDLKYCKQQISQKELKIETLSTKYQASLSKIQQIEANYSKTIEIAQKKHEELVKSLQNELCSKVASTTPKKDSKLRHPDSSSPISSKDVDLQDELKRWKIQYKILKERYQAYTKVQNQSKSDLKQYYRGYRESKQRIDVLTHKNKLLERQFEKYMKALTEKDAQLLKKEIELRKTANEVALEKGTSTRQLIALRDRCKTLEEKLNQQSQRADKQASYRKEIEQKVLGNEVTDESLKGVIERTKKRLAQQDEKISKNVKESKNKQTLIQKLKQELRELMENTEREEVKKRSEQIAKIVEQHLKKEGEALVSLKERLQQETKFAEENQKGMLDQIQSLKLQNNDLNRKMVETNNQLRLISHSYNTKTMEMSNLLFERSRQLQDLEKSLQEAQVMAISVEGSLRQQLNQKNEEIALLRRQVITRLSFNSSGIALTGNFDEVLRNQIEGNAKLREEASKRAEQIYKLRDNYTTIKSQYENIKSQSDVNKLKFLSEKKNMEVAFQVQVQNYKNIIDGWQKKVIALEQKMKMMIQQNQKKDQFIKNFIIGKKISQNQKEVLNDFMKQFEISMGSKDIVDRLTEESKIIQNLEKYNQSLLKQIAVMKQKLVLFEAIDLEKISLYESKVSKRSHKSIEQKDLQDLNEQQFYNSRLKKALSLQDFVPPEAESEEKP